MNVTSHLEFLTSFGELAEQKQMQPLIELLDQIVGANALR